MYGLFSFLWMVNACFIKETNKENDKFNEKWNNIFVVIFFITSKNRT
jgi:hypothetical protein